MDEAIIKGRFVDTNTKETYCLLDDIEFIVSDTAVETCSHKVLVIPPAIDGESYVLRITGNPPFLNLIHGSCTVNGKALTKPLSLSSGTFVMLGSARCLQYTCSGSIHSPPIRRVLPPTPGKGVGPSPPSKPPRNKQQHGTPLPVLVQPTLAGYADTGIRQRLQRIAAEVSSRLVGYEGRKPPPPYEQVGNSIGYQLLHQQQHEVVTSDIIDALYPALKENEIKDSSLVNTYTAYLQAFKLALENPASIQCMLPADLPTVDFVVDMLLHLCCMPHMTCLAEKQGELWCRLLAFFSQSHQNQLHMARKRHPTRILSCMHLNMMSSKRRFQQYGWTVLANTVAMPTPTGGKPVLSEPSLTLALSLTECQLATSSSDIPLVVAIINFLSTVATSAKLSTSHASREEQTYTEEQALRILALFQEKFVLRHVMKVPPHLRSESSFEQAYSKLVKALVPVRGQSRTSPPLRVPKRGSKFRRSTIGGSNKAVKKTTFDKSEEGDSSPLDSIEATTKAQLLKRSSHETTDVVSDSPALHRVCSDSNLHSRSKPSKSRFASCSDLLTGSDPSDDDEPFQEVARLETEDIVLVSKNESTSDSTQTQQQTSSPNRERTNVEETCTSPPSEPVEMSGNVELSESSQLSENTQPNGITSPPLTPNTANLAADVQDLLNTLHTPLEVAAPSNSVKVPTLSRYNRYYRHSIKKRNEQETEQTTQDDTRLLWGKGVTQPFVSSEQDASMFEVSGKFLSSQHLTMEEVTTGHLDILFTLQSRFELLEGVLSLWSRSKGLQAATNLLQGCFSNNCVDNLHLFVEILHCFLSYKSPWTLAVCVVLLPPLHQLILSQTQMERVQVLADTILMIVERFSDLILVCKAVSKTKFRLSASVNREQQLVCYGELHSIQHDLDVRLKTNKDSVQLTSIMHKVHVALKPFSNAK